MLWRQGLSEEQLEHSGWDVSDDICYRHPGLFFFQLGYQDPGHAQGAEATAYSKAAAVSDTKVINPPEKLET